jgi:hypothetical protein
MVREMDLERDLTGSIVIARRLGRGSYEAAPSCVDIAVGKVGLDQRDFFVGEVMLFALVHITTQRLGPKNDRLPDILWKLFCAKILPRFTKTLSSAVMPLVFSLTALH